MINTSSLKPSRRKHYRIQVPIRVDINGTVMDTADWSMGGFRVEGFLGNDPEPTLQVGISIPFQGYWISANAHIKVIRYNKSKGTLAAEFVDLSERTKEVLEYFAGGLLSGEMAGLEGAIQRLDSPVTPVDIKVTKSAKELTVRYHVSRWLKYALYIAIGSILTWYVGSSIYQRVWLLEVTSASLVSPIEQIRSPDNGIISTLLVSEGQQVTKGTPLFRLEPQDETVLLSNQQMDIEEARITLNQLQESRKYEEEKVDIYRGVIKARADASKANLGQIQQQAVLKQRDVDRFASLLESGAVSQSALDNVRIELHELQSRLAVAQSKHQVDLSYLSAIERGYIFEGERLQSSLADLDVNIGAAQLLLIAAKNQHTMTGASNPANLVLAPFDGRITELAQSEGTAIRRGEPVVTIEQPQQRSVEAYLTADEANYVKLHDHAVVEIRALGWNFNATVVAIGATTELANQAHSLGKDPKLHATLKLTSVIGEGDFETALAELSAINSIGLPVKVSFKRSWD